MNVQKTKTRQQIADEYGISRRTFYRWLKKVGIQLTSGNVTLKEQAKIYQEFGEPPEIEDNKK